MCTHLLMHCGRGCHLFYLVFLLLSGLWQLFGFCPARCTEEWVRMLGLGCTVEWVRRLGRGGVRPSGGSAMEGSTEENSQSEIMDTNRLVHKPVAATLTVFPTILICKYLQSPAIDGSHVCRSGAEFEVMRKWSPHNAHTLVWYHYIHQWSHWQQ